MSGSSCPTDGLLLLLKAAEKLNEVEFQSKSDYRRNTCELQPRSYHYCIKPDNSSTYINHNRNISINKFSHNELEKSRRAHLRIYIEVLKERLIFDNDVPRITILTVLKKATSTIQSLRHRCQYLEVCEDNEKQKCAQLLKRRQSLRKMLEDKRNRTSRIMSLGERNRNYSECSILTSSFEEVEIDPTSHQSSHHKFTNPTLMAPSASPSEFITDDIVYATGVNYSLPTSRKLTSSPGEIATPLSGMDVFDASSSDSGFEEVTISCAGTTPTERRLNYFRNSHEDACAGATRETC